MDDDEMLKVSDVIKLLHCHRNTVKRIPRDELPYWRLGKRGDRRYTLEDVRAYIERNYYR